MQQGIEFQVDAEHPVRCNPGACSDANGHIQILVGAITGAASRAVRQMAEAYAGIRRPRPCPSDEVFAGEATAFDIPVRIACLAARRRRTEAKFVTIWRSAVRCDQKW